MVSVTCVLVIRIHQTEPPTPIRHESFEIGIVNLLKSGLGQFETGRRTRMGRLRLLPLDWADAREDLRVAGSASSLGWKQQLGVDNALK